MAIELTPNPLDEADAKYAEQERLLAVELEGVRQIRRGIAAMRGGARRDNAGDLPAVTPGQYAGMRTGPALEAYIKARPGFRIPHERAAEDLFAGGAAIGDRGRGAPGRVQALRIALGAKRKIKIVEYDDNVLWLAPTAGEAPPKRNVGKKRSRRV